MDIYGETEWKAIWLDNYMDQLYAVADGFIEGGMNDYIYSMDMEISVDRSLGELPGI